MKRVIKNEVVVAFLMIFGGVMVLNAGPAFSAPRELSGEVIRVNPEKKQVILKVDDKKGRAREVEIRLGNNASIEGVPGLASLEKGTSVHVQAENQPFSRIWVASRLEVAKSEGKRGMNSVEKSDLHDLEQKAAHGEVAEGQYEARRQSLEPGKKIEF